ncbi:hypothetical protein I6G56_15815 [Burkholderia humptydooensis]|uniref:Uncharacterized protein n=1 Tax=Burkholderia humptydooensis TaxID=430531 RepID=A0A7T2U038_9BURK|nr:MULTISPECIES: hypothetical protein [Burkholderia]QPS43019.1 hypothetical protein I6G56_15815 [Burkholderia humptydooensis]
MRNSQIKCDCGFAVYRSTRDCRLTRGVAERYPDGSVEIVLPLQLVVIDERPSQGSAYYRTSSKKVPQCRIREGETAVSKWRIDDQSALNLFAGQASAEAELPGDLFERKPCTPDSVWASRSATSRMYGARASSRDFGTRPARYARLFRKA